MSYYSDPEAVRIATGVQPEDLGLDDTDELDTLLESWLTEVKDIIDRDRRQDFSDTDVWAEVPALVTSVARRMAGNAIAIAIVRRETPIIRIDDFSVKLVEDRLLTEDIRRDLALIPRGRTYSSPFRLWRVRTADQQADDEATDE